MDSKFALRIAFDILLASNGTTSPFRFLIFLMTGVGAISSIPSFVASCELSPSSVSDFDYTISTFPRQDKTQYIVTITNNSGEEIVYWLEYRLGDMQDIDYTAPTLADGESKTWSITGRLSATAEKENGLGVYVVSKKEFDIYKKAHKDRKDSSIIMYNSEVPHIFNSFDAADSYNVVIKGTSSSSDIKLQ